MYMLDLSKIKGFEWDKGNVDKSWIKHKVSNREAEEAFVNKPNFIFKDEKHSTLETRYLLWGATNKKRGLSIVFTMGKNQVRIISARDLNRKERKEYETK